MFGSKNKKNKGEEKKESVKFDLETMESDMKDPFKKKDVEITSNIPIKNNEKPQKASAKNMPPRNTPETPSKSPFLTDEIASVTPSDFGQEIQKNKERDHGQAPTPKEQFPKEKIPAVKPEVPQNLPTAEKAEMPKTDKPVFPGVPEQKAKKEASNEEIEKYLKQSVSRKKKSVNMPLLIIAVVVLVATIAAGAYYYFFVLNQSSETVEIPSQVNEGVSTDQQDTTDQTDVSTETTNPTDTLSDTGVLNSAEVLIIENNDPNASLINYIALAKEDMEKSAMLAEGFFVRVQDENGIVSSVDLLDYFTINIPNLDLYIEKDAYLFLASLKDTDTVKVALVLSIESNTSAAIVKEHMKVEEKVMPSQIKVLMIDETAPEVPDQVDFSPSLVNIDFRFFNYIAENTDQSTDWGVMKYKEANYIVFTTSKDSTEKITKALDPSQ